MEDESYSMEKSCEIGKDGIYFRKENVQVGKSGITNVSTGVALIISEDDLILGDYVGKGASGYVQKAIHKLTGQVLALKSIGIYDRSKRHQLMNDIKSLEDSQCPYLVQFYGGYYSDGRVTIALEFMDMGSLKTVITGVRENPSFALPEKVLANMIYQMIQGLLYLHKYRHQVHRDIKPDNILLNSDGLVKLTDFGISKELEFTAGLCNTFCGTATYMSPERVVANPYSYSSDIWSLGLVIFELVTGIYPYPVTSVYIEMAESILNQPEPSFAEDTPYSPELKDFLRCCLQKDPMQRASASELLKHEFLRIHSDSLADTAIVREWIQSFYN